jgi:hypothetical protein
MQALKHVFALSALVSLPVWAVPPATVTAVQAPAWLERAGKAKPLAVGMPIENGDRIRTGDDARAVLQLAEGSTLQLGADAKVAFFSMSAKPRTEYKGALDVVAGAFRFSTHGAKRVKSRDVVVRVGAVSAGMRGTDLWGRSDAQEDVICVLDGKVDVWHAALPEPLVMATPMTYVAAAKGQAPKPVAAVDAQQWQQWARQTEVGRGAGAERSGGKFALVLGQFASEGQALEQYDIARGAGYDVSVRPVAAASGAWEYQLLVKGFADEREASAAALRLKAATGLDAATTRSVGSIR